MESLWHLTTTNQAPTDDERGRLKETLAEYDEKLNTVTHKISILEEQLRILNKEKTALLEASAPIHRALSPFRQLPEDVVRAIFVACLETRWNPTMANTEAPVLLTRISRATRLIALTTPELWAAIHIPIITSVPVEVVDNQQNLLCLHELRASKSGCFDAQAMFPSISLSMRTLNTGGCLVLSILRLQMIL